MSSSARTRGPPRPPASTGANNRGVDHSCIRLLLRVATRPGRPLVFWTPETSGDTFPHGSRFPHPSPRCQPVDAAPLRAVRTHPALDRTEGDSVPDEEHSDLAAARHFIAQYDSFEAPGSRAEFLDSQGEDSRRGPPFSKSSQYLRRSSAARALLLHISPPAPTTLPYTPVPRTRLPPLAASGRLPIPAREPEETSGRHCRCHGDHQDRTVLIRTRAGAPAPRARTVRAALSSPGTVGCPERAGAAPGACPCHRAITESEVP